MYKIYLSIVLIYLLIPVSCIFSAEYNRSDFVLTGGLTIGYQFSNYFRDVNTQLEEDHKIDEIYRLPIMGVECALFKRRFIFSTSILSSFADLKSDGTNDHKPIVKGFFREFNVSAKAGFLIFSNRDYQVYPYVGLEYEYLRIKMDVNYSIRCFDCFFQSKNRYSIFDVGIISGITFNRTIHFKNCPCKVVIGLDVQGFVSLVDNVWKINGEKINDSLRMLPQLDGGGRVRMKMAVQL